MQQQQYQQQKFNNQQQFQQQKLNNQQQFQMSQKETIESGGNQNIPSRIMAPQVIYIVHQTDLTQLMTIKNQSKRFLLVITKYGKHN